MLPECLVVPKSLPVFNSINLTVSFLTVIGISNVKLNIIQMKQMALVKGYYRSESFKSLSGNNKVVQNMFFLKVCGEIII